MRLEFSEEARLDLDDIYLFGLDDHGVAQADAYMAGLRALLTIIADNPLIGRERDEIRPPIRIFPYQSHHIFYDVLDDVVVVQRLLHHSVDWMAGL